MQYDYAGFSQTLIEKWIKDEKEYYCNNGK